MKKTNKTEKSDKSVKFTLDAQSIDAISERADNYFTSHSVEKKAAKRICITIEEALLKYREIFPENTVVLYREILLLGQVRIQLDICGNSFNPFEIARDPNDLLMDSLLTGITGNAPSWKFNNFVNTLTFFAQRENRYSLLGKIGIAIVFGISLGLLSHLMPDEVRSVLANDYIKPIADIYTNLMSVMAVLMTFFAIALGIAHTGNLTAVSHISRKMIGRMTVKDIAFILIFMLCLTPFQILGLSSVTNIDAKSLLDLVLGFVPSNPIAPLLNFNTAQIIIVGAMFGFSILKMGENASTLEKTFSECNSVAVICNGFLNSGLVHIYVWLRVFVITASDSPSNITDAVKIIAITLAAYAAVMLFYTLYTCVKLRMSPINLLRRLMPTFIVNLSSASYGASFHTSFETIMSFGPDVNYVSIGHNLGGLLFKPAHMLLFCSTAIISANMSGMQISLGWLLMLFVLSILLSATIPCIPGAAVSAFTLLFVQLGLPSDYLALAAAMNAVMDFFTVAVNGYCLQCELITGAEIKSK